MYLRKFLLSVEMHLRLLWMTPARKCYKPPGRWIRGPEQHRRTLNRRKRAADVLAREATKCQKIDRFFGSLDTAMPVMPLPSTTKDLISTAKEDLKKKIESKKERLTGQKLIRHQ